MTPQVQAILNNYASENPGCKANLVRLLNHGSLSGTGKMIIYPVDQGFEHGPDRSFSNNPASYDPLYHFNLAYEANVNAFAAPLGLLECGADKYAGQIPLILKLNSSNSLYSKSLVPDQAVTASVQDALRLGCIGIGYTIYPGSDKSLEQFEELRELIKQAKACGLLVVVWSYARGNELSKDAETALDVISYGAHMACLLGAHIVKVKLPTAYIEQKEAKDVFEKSEIARSELKDRVKHVVTCCFDGRRLVVFSGGDAKTPETLLKEVQAIAYGGGSGSIVGRNCFQRPKQEALDLLKNMTKILKD